MRGLRKFLTDDRGTTAIEYGLIVAMVSIVVVVVWVVQPESMLTGTFRQIADTLDGVNGGGADGS